MTDYKKIIRYSLLFAAMIPLCRFTRGYAALVLSAAALMNANSSRPTLAIFCCIMLSFLNCVTGYIIGDRQMLMYAYRCGFLAIGLVLSVKEHRNRLECTPPLKMLFVYCAVAVVSSLFGYAFNVSLLKLAYFVLFVLCLNSMARCVAEDVALASEVRHLFLAICLAFLLGSLWTLRYPAIAYPLNSIWLLREGMDLEDANELMSQGLVSSGISLFAGMTFHSQMLAPILVFVVMFLVCDMLFVVGKISRFHFILIAIALIFSYMTRSRTALGALVLSGFAILGVKHSGMSFSWQRKIRAMVGVLFIAICIACIIVEVRSSLLTKWIVKGEQAKSITLETVVDSRITSIRQLWGEFKQKPLFGNGFQVSANFKHLKGFSFGLSAPIEKGNVFLMVLHECGIIGMIIFSIFIFTFYSFCNRRFLQCTQLAMTSFLFVNLGEAVFFSPGSTGGLGWLFVIVGGFVLDVVKKHLSRNQYVIR